MRILVAVLLVFVHAANSFADGDGKTAGDEDRSGLPAFVNDFEIDLPGGIRLSQEGAVNVPEGGAS